MHNITLICTRHEENGICNSDELYKIIEKVNPEVIFEEMPPSYFNSFYKDKSMSNLESNAINKYLENHKINHVPVDFFNVNECFFDDHQHMCKRIEDISFEYRQLVDTYSLYGKRYGFKFFNSAYCNNLRNEINDTIEKTLDKINDDKFFQIYKSWNEIINSRETEMINNIYKHSQEHRFERGLFFIGAAHRESIINKIQKHAETESVKLNWNYSNYDNIL